MPKSLPIDDVLPDVIASLRSTPTLVLVAPPGAGKTTRVPPALVDADLVQTGLVLLQPRRVAARAAASRIAAENGWKVGQQVGYQVRFDRKLTTSTRIKVVTEGILLRWLQDDPFLEGVDVVLFDEFHLRSVNSDLCLGLLRELAAELRPDLRLVVMSATIDPTLVARYLGDCPVLTADVGRPFPISIELQPRVDERPLGDRVASAVGRCLREQRTGDLLVFLPGMREIRQAASALQRSLPVVQRGEVEVAPLHGSLPAGEQDAVLRGSAKRRRVVLATNVAETSLTIPGISCVVDSGLVRLPRHDPRSGLDRLEVCRVSCDSADQRAGRAGRVSPGLVYRLWTRGQHNRLATTTAPEVQRVELATVVLTLASWGSDPSSFEWLDAPDEAVVKRAITLLTRLGALDDAGSITNRGRQMLRLPLHPRVGRMLLQAEQLDCLWPVAGIAALLAEGDFTRSSRVDRPSAPSDLVERLESIDSPDSALEIDRGALRRVVRAQRQLFRTAKDALGSMQRQRASQPNEEAAIREAVLAGFPDRVARRRAPGSDQAVMVGGRGVVLSRTSVVREAELFVAVLVDATDKSVADSRPRQERVLLASAIEPAWLQKHKEQRLTFDEQQGRVVATERWLYEDLCLEQRSITADDEQAAAVLATHAAKEIERSLALSKEDRAWLARVRFLRHHLPALGLPPCDAQQLRELLPTLCVGKRSITQLQQVALGPWLRGLLTPRQLRSVEQNAPEQLEVPSGARIRLQYRQADEPPVLAVQLQQMFGLADTPRVASGKVAVLLHLLAPNQRPVQVTQDLRSFWDVTYADVRKELRRRYPKHAWPEDPWTASAERRPRRRR